MFRSQLSGKVSKAGEKATKIVSEIWLNWDHPVRREMGTDKLIDGGGQGNQVKKEILVLESEAHLFKGPKLVIAKPDKKTTYERRSKKNSVDEPKRKPGQVTTEMEEAFV